MNYLCQICRDAEGTFLKKPVEMTIKGELQTVMMDYWEDCECVTKRKQAQKQASLFASSHITDAFRKKTFDNFTLDERPECIWDAYRAAESYVFKYPSIKESDHNSLALLGMPGNGKTHLLAAIANALMEQGNSVFYFPWVEGMFDLRDDFSKMSSRIRHLQTTPLLLIDDLFKGREKPTDFQMEQLFAIVNERYLNMLPMVISSEWTFEQLCDHDEALGSRLAHRCKHFTVLMDAPNYRFM